MRFAHSFFPFPSRLTLATQATTPQVHVHVGTVLSGVLIDQYGAHNSPPTYLAAINKSNLI